MSFELTTPQLLDLPTYEDERGWFMELHNRSGHPLAGADFTQDNVSWSHEWVLRGLHYQLPPHEQGKLIWVARGSIFDAIVDIRRSSDTFGRWWSFNLTDSEVHQLWVPPGFAHGFLAMAEPTVVVYKVTAAHAPPSERSIRWDDPTIGVDWPLEGNDPIVSHRDRSAPTLAKADVFD